MGPVNMLPYNRDFASVIKLMIMRWEDYPAYPGGPNGKWKGEMGESEKGTWPQKQHQNEVIGGFEEERGS